MLISGLSLITVEPLPRWFEYCNSFLGNILPNGRASLVLDRFYVDIGVGRTLARSVPCVSSVCWKWWHNDSARSTLFALAAFSEAFLR